MDQPSTQQPGMKLYTSPRAPNPRRVLMFLAEKGLSGIEQVAVDLNAGEHRAEAFRAKSPLAKVPALQLQDGRVLTETRAICTYLEGLAPEPDLMGRKVYFHVRSHGYEYAADMFGNRGEALDVKPGGAGAVGGNGAAGPGWPPRRIATRPARPRRGTRTARRCSTRPRRGASPIPPSTSRARRPCSTSA